MNKGQIHLKSNIFRVYQTCDVVLLQHNNITLLHQLVLEIYYWFKVQVQSMSICKTAQIWSDSGGFQDPVQTGVYFIYTQ